MAVIAGSTAGLGDALDVASGVESAPTLPPGYVPPEQPEAPAPSKLEGEAPQNLGAQWRDFLNQPGNMAAMVQFGIALSQRIAPGQSVLGHITNAVGTAGEAKQATVAAQEESDLKKAQADYYSGRSQYYASGGAAGGLTANQLLMQARYQDAQFREMLDTVAFNLHNAVFGFDSMVPGSPEQMEVLQQAALQYRQLYGRPPGGLPQVVGGTLQEAIPPVGGAAPTPAPQAGRTPPPAAIAHLKANPQLAAEFDKHYGPGMAKAVLGQ